MSEMFGENNDAVKAQGGQENPMSLDGRQNILEQKVNDCSSGYDSSVNYARSSETMNNQQQNAYYQPVSFVPKCNENRGERGGSMPGTSYYRNPYAPMPAAENQGGSPYANVTDYTGGAPYYAPAPKKKMDKNLKAFLIVISSITAIFVLAFVVECVRNANNGGMSLDLDEWLDTDYGYDFSIPDIDDFEDTDSSEDLLDSDSQKTLKDAPDSDGVINAEAAKLTVADQPENLESGDYSAQKAYKRVENSVVDIVVYDGEVGNDSDAEGSGSGIIVSDDGYVVTNSHVINNSNEYGVEVITTEGVSYKAAIVGFDTRTDLAVLKIDATGLSPVEFVNSDQIQVGQDALAVGSPGGVTYSNSLTRGAVSALNRTISSNKLVTYIQTDAAINPGNSGGPLLNIAGQVMGITTIKIVNTEYEGMGFAIPSNTVIDIVNDLIGQGYVSDRVRLGIVGRAVSNYVSISDTPSGIVITDFADDSPFKGTDAQVNDIITAINGEEISDFSGLYAELAKYEPGDEVTVSLYRPATSTKRSQTFDVKITLVADNGETQKKTLN